MQTFEMGAANFSYAECLENIGLVPKLGALSEFEVKKLHDFEVICPKRGLRLHPRPPPAYGPE